MKFKNIFLVLAISSMLFLTACSSGEVEQSLDGAFIGGTQGIEVAFEPFSIEEEGVFTIFDTEDFPIDVVVTNLGEQTVEVGDVVLSLLGPAPDDFSNIPDWTKENTRSIEKISEFNPNGGEEIISFTPNSYATYDSEVIGFTDITWNLNFKYDYATHLIVDDVCFKGDVTDDRVCEVSEAKVYSVSGAPITVTSVEQDSGGKGIMVLKIDIANQGTGESTMIDAEFDDRFSQVSYTIDDESLWECKSGGRENEARLIDGQAEIICRLKESLAEDDLYTKSVGLSIEYTYQDLIQETLRIKQSAE